MHTGRRGGQSTARGRHAAAHDEHWHTRRKLRQHVAEGRRRFSFDQRFVVLPLEGQGVGALAVAVPVRAEGKLQGVVVDLSEPRARALIIADATASIYVSSPKNIFSSNHPRDLMEIEGVSSAGEFAPCVVVSKARTLRSGGAEIPPPRPASRRAN